MKILLSLFVLFAFGLAVPTAYGRDTDTAKKAAKLKKSIQDLGTGKDARVRLKLTDGSKVKGYVAEIKADSFVVASDALPAPVEIPYVNVKQVNGSNLSTGVQIAIGVVAVLTLLSLIGMAVDN